MHQSTYIWQLPNWPKWQVDMLALSKPLESACKAQGTLLGRLHDLGVDERKIFSVSVLTADVIKSNEIEGEQLNVHSVRSSIARRLGVDVGALTLGDSSVDGVVDIVLDVTQKYECPLSKERLCAWHIALLRQKAGRLPEMSDGEWRSDLTGPMQVVSGRINHEHVHFTAPPSSQLDEEIALFIEWVNDFTSPMPDLLRAGLGHLWFVTIHPFDDGNGRIARAVGDMLLARADRASLRFYSFSSQIMRQREEYYEILERTQKGSMDVTEWMLWFLNNLESAIKHAHCELDKVFAAKKFWRKHSNLTLNRRQKQVLAKMLDSTKLNKITNKKWQSLTQASADTSLRDLTELVKLEVIVSKGAGRGFHYLLKDYDIKST